MLPTLAGYDLYSITVGGALFVGTVSLILVERTLPVSSGRYVLAGVILGCIMLIGAKGYWHLEQMWNGRAATLQWSVGYRQPGVLLAIFAIPIVSRLMVPEIAIGKLVDSYVLPVAAALSAFRVGCLLRGCCYGTVTGVPWAIRFPAGSPAWRHHEALGLIQGFEDVSLPVHALQLYLAAAVLISAMIAIATHRLLRPRPGATFLLFVCLNQSAKFFLECLRPVEKFAPAQVQMTDGAAAVVAGLALGSLLLRRSGNRASRSSTFEPPVAANAPP